MGFIKCEGGQGNSPVTETFKAVRINDFVNKTTIYYALTFSND